MFRVGVDVGGTFTDLALLDAATGRLHVSKVPSTPRDPSDGIANVVRLALQECGGSTSEVTFLAHGTTVGTNALLEGKGARTALLTTRGFGDLLEIGRQKRPSLYDLMADKPTPLVPRQFRLEVSERLRADGSVLIPLRMDEVEAAVTALRASGIESVAICFLHSFQNPEHEERTRATVTALAPEMFVAASSSVVAEWREFERLSTTVLNAYLGKVMSGYVMRFGARMRDLGIPATPHVMQSNGGLISLQRCADQPVRTVLSGPSAGVVGAAHLAKAAGFADIITFDMGGTSTDVCLVKSGSPTVSVERSLEGYPVRIPTVDVHTIGAGGGSIAWLDRGQALRVGPVSAGAAPGPACYGLGGEAPAVTDADLVLGRLNPQHLLGGRMDISMTAAREAIDRMVARPLGLDTVEAAAGVVAVVNSNMIRALRVVSVGQGEPPEDFCLVAFGGAGPVHAADVARQLGVRSLLIPSRPGILCALGLLITDLRADFARTRVLIAEPDNAEQVATIFSGLDHQASEWLGAEGVPVAARRVHRSIDMRYRRQNFEIRIPLAAGAVDAAALREAVARFHEQHRRQYGYASPETPVQMVTYRVEGIGVTEASMPACPDVRPAGEEPAPVGRRPVYFPERRRFLSARVYSRDELLPGDRLVGPAVVEQLDSTTVLPPRAVARVDEYLNLVVAFGQRRRSAAHSGGHGGASSGGS